MSTRQQREVYRDAIALLDLATIGINQKVARIEDPIVALELARLVGQIAQTSSYLARHKPSDRKNT